MLDISGGNIELNTYGVFNINLFTYTAITNISNATFNENDYGVSVAGGIVNIIDGVVSGTRSAVGVSAGTLNIGTNDGAVSTEKPEIIGEVYGVESDLTSEAINFYDGIIKGKTKSVYGQVPNTESGYSMITDKMDEYIASIIVPSGTIEVVAECDNLSYTTLQSAIDSCTSEKQSTIILKNSIRVTEPIIIKEGQNIIIDLAGLEIRGTNLEYTIQNGGTLTFIDSSDEQTGKVSNTYENGTVIQNTGTLNIGIDDGTISTTCPEISGGLYGIENTGIFNFYDGSISGGTSAIKGETDTKIYP